MEEGKTLDEIKESIEYDFDPFSLWGDKDEEQVDEERVNENSITQDGCEKDSAQGSEEKTATMLSLYRDD